MITTHINKGKMEKVKMFLILIHQDFQKESEKVKKNLTIKEQFK